MILVCESTVFLTRSTIQSSPSFKSLWLDQDVMRSEFIFAPFNISNCHWVLVAVDMKQQKITYIDPMCMNTPASDINFKKGTSVISKLLNKKSSINVSEFYVISPKHKTSRRFLQLWRLCLFLCKANNRKEKYRGHI